MAIKSFKINFAKEFYKTRSLPLNSQRLVNMYGEPQTEDSRSELALFSCPGLRTSIEVSTFFTVYALKKMGEYLYAVVGNVLYQIDSTLTATAKGTLGTSPGKVRLSSNGLQLTVLTSLGSAWTYNASTDTFAQITDPNFQNASDVTFLDGYTIFSKLNSGQFFWSELNDSTSYDALDFQTAEWEPDNLVGIRKVAAELWAFGENTIEVYQNTGDALLFGRISGAAINIGCIARDTITTIDNSVIWVGDDRMVYMATGYVPTKISSFAIDKEFQSYVITDFEAAESFTYDWDGHKFYVLTFPTLNKTFQFDIITGLWSERESIDQATRNIIRWRATCSERYKNYTFAGDYQAGVIYYFEDDYFYEGDSPFYAEIVTSPQFNSFLRTSVLAIYLDIETGVGIATGQGSDPEIMFQFSRDGGRTYSNEIWRKLGKKGEYRTLVKFTSIGSADNYTFKFRISDPIKKNILGAYIDFEEGES